MPKYRSLRDLLGLDDEALEEIALTDQEEELVRLIAEQGFDPELFGLGELGIDLAATEADGAGAVTGRA